MNFIKYIPFVRDLPLNYQVLLVIISVPILVWLVSTLIRAVIMNFVLAPIRRYAKTTETDLDNRALDVIERPIRVLLIGVAIAIISNTLQFRGDLEQISNNIANALIITAIFYFVYNLVDIIGVTSANVQRFTGLHIEDRLLPFLRVVAKVFVVVMGLLIVIQEFGYSITGLLASFGVIGLAISLAAQDTAANVIGFTSIVSDNPFEMGDYIVTGDIAGTVEKVGVRTTRIRKLDQSLVTMPNHSLTDAAVTNWSRLSKRRLDFYIGLTYQTTASQMRDVLQQIRDMLKDRDMIDTESVIVNFVEFDDSALNIRVIAYVLLADWAEFVTEQELINLNIMDIVETAGVSMAFPSTSVYIESQPKVTQPEPIVITPEMRVQKADLSYDSQAEIEQGTPEASYQDNEAASSDSSEDAE
ncbi:MAG: mechanosensitive ion channel family protein [Phototrophicaceae bacterium]